MRLESHKEIEAALSLGTICHASIPEDVYRSFWGMNYSQLKAFEKSPSKYLYEKENPQKPSPAQELGSAIHSILLEPELFYKTYVVQPKFDRRTKDGKANAELWESQHQGKTALSYDEFNICEKLRKVVDNDAFFKRFFNGGIAESVFMAKDKATDIILKGKLDYYIPSKNVVIDLKTTDSAHPSSFIWDIKKYGYHNQGAFYYDLVERATGVKPEAYIIIAVEKNKDCDMQAYFLGEEELEICRNRYMNWLLRFKECHDKGEFPGYERQFIEFNTAKGFHA
jgi:hypothetical protein